MRVTFVSSFVPRKCGIATYTRDLARGLKLQGNKIAVIAMDNPNIQVSYLSPVTQIIRQNEIEDYKKAAENINNSPADIVHIEHEFGLFGGDDGEYILNFAREIKKPLIVTFHTVLLSPSEHQKYIVQELARLSRKVTIMENIAKDRLENIYGLNPQDISVIYHGVPEILMNKKQAKKALRLSNKFILLANNLLSRNKGIEYAIEAVDKARKEIPNLIFLVVGETHPLVKNEEGEAYRNELINLVKKLHLEKNVRFINEYVSLKDLQKFLAAADVYITPYLDPQQITSGTLSYALGAGKACIATEYIYAKEMLKQDRGILVPFKDKGSIEEALIGLYKNPKKRHEIEKNAHVLRKQMSWKHVAREHVRFYKDVIRGENNISFRVQNFLRQPIDISYLQHMSDGIGLLQHAFLTIPNRRFGYATDDNARALIIASFLNRKDKSKVISNLVEEYLGFLQFAKEPSGKFHTFLNFHRHWDDKEAVTDAYGRAMWGLGFYLYANNNFDFGESINSFFAESFNQLDHIVDLRTAAYTILGLYYYILAYKDKTDTAAVATVNLKKLADFLIKSYKKCHSKNWQWFEEEMTYDNFRIPQALFAAYMVTGDEEYKKVAVTTLDFLTTCNFSYEAGYFDFVGQNGWYKKQGKKAEYDQQPLEAAGAVEAFLFAEKALDERKYHKDAVLAFQWFFGKNRNHRYIYDPATKGVRDGLTKVGVNLNEGAESLVCFLIAALSLKEFIRGS